MRNSGYTKLLKRQHVGSWIALNEDKTKLLGYSRNLPELTKKYGKKGVFYTKVLDGTQIYAY